MEAEAAQAKSGSDGMETFDLMPDFGDEGDQEETVVADLEALNGFDRDLYGYALALDDARTAHAPREPRRDGGAAPCENPPSRQLGSKTGIFRPRGHKHR